MREIDEALYGFFAGFGLPVYREDDAPSEAQPPYITVHVAQPAWDASVPIYARVWYRGASYGPIDDKVDEIAAAIGHGGTSIKTTTGSVWLYRQDSFAQHMPMTGDPSLQCVYLSMSLRALTA